MDNIVKRYRSLKFRWFLNSKPFLVRNLLRKNTAITTKLGLTNNLKELVWYENIDSNEFYPKCYDLKNDDDMQLFVSEFKFNKA